MVRPWLGVEKILHQVGKDHASAPIQMDTVDVELPAIGLCDSVTAPAQEVEASIDNDVNDECGVEERRCRWPQRLWATSVLIVQAILRR